MWRNEGKKRENTFMLLVYGLLHRYISGCSIPINLSIDFCILQSIYVTIYTVIYQAIYPLFSCLLILTHLLIHAILRTCLHAPPSPLWKTPPIDAAALASATACPYLSILSSVSNGGGGGGQRRLPTPLIGQKRAFPSSISSASSGGMNMMKVREMDREHMAKIAGPGGSYRRSTISTKEIEKATIVSIWRRKRRWSFCPS